MKLLLTVLFIVLSTISTQAQDYIQYNYVSNRVNECIVQGDMKGAAIKLDSLYDDYTFMFARHCFKALQIACELNDTERVYKWLNKCFLQGVPVWMVRANAITAKSQNYPLSYNIINSHDSLYRIYLSRINLPLANTIDSMFVYDQKCTQKVNFGFVLWRVYYYPRWLHNNGKTYRAIQAMLKQYGYPGERLIGLPESLRDSLSNYKFFVRRGHIPIQRIELQYMLMHCYSNPRKDIREDLLKQISLGNLEVGQYGVYADFMAEYGRQKYGKFPRYYQWFKDHAKEDTLTINARRDSIGLPSFQLRAKQLALFDSSLKHNIRNMILADVQ